MCDSGLSTPRSPFSSALASCESLHEPSPTTDRSFAEKAESTMSGVMLRGQFDTVTSDAPQKNNISFLVVCFACPAPRTGGCPAAAGSTVWLQYRERKSCNGAVGALFCWPAFMVIVLRVLPERGKSSQPHPAVNPVNCNTNLPGKICSPIMGMGAANSFLVLGPFHRRNPNFVKAHVLRSQALQVTCLLWGHIFKDLWGPFRFLSALRPYQSLLRFRLEGKVHVLGTRMFSRLFLCSVFSFMQQNDF